MMFFLHTHLVFVTKYRKGLFTKVMSDYMREIFDSVCKDLEVLLVEYDREGDQVHLLVNYLPRFLSQN